MSASWNFRSSSLYLPHTKMMGYDDISLGAVCLSVTTFVSILDVGC